MTFPRTTNAEWRAQVDKELAGKPFEKALVHETLDGVSIAPLYTEPTALPRVLGDGAPFRVCMEHRVDPTAAEIAADLEGGADGLWLTLAAAALLPKSVAAHVTVVIDVDDAHCTVNGEPAALVSTLAHHDAGADASEELAIALSTCVARINAGAVELVVRVAVGRDTFVELCKLRALRLCVRKVLAAYGEPLLPAPTLHAVCSSRTLTTRDPWVNMLRVTTQTFAAVLGGADLVTPLAFDRALATPSAIGRRIARNTGHILREESALGRVMDPGAGSYYFDAVTDALAREAWSRFRAIEADGGIDAAKERVDASIARARRARQAQIATRKLSILGVSDFANLDETLPSPPAREDGVYRDAAAFEALRERATAPSPTALLATVGTQVESRARVGFAAAFFASGGVRASESAGDGVAPIACLCGTDERYATEAAERARALKAAGCRHVLLAGRPGALEASLREAGVDGFLFVGCDAVAVLSKALEACS